MLEIQRSVLFEKLNEQTYKALENAVTFCRMRGNPYVEFTHWLHQLMQSNDNDLHHLTSHYSLNSSHVAADIVKALEELPSGSTSISDLSSTLDNIMENTWKYTSLYFNASVIRSGHIIFTLLNTKFFAGTLLNVSQEFKKIKIYELGENFNNILVNSTEAKTVRKTMEPTGELDESIPGHKQEALNQFSTNLTEKAAKGQLDPVIGRNNEIRQIVDILMRRRQNNPILVGEPGVGKSAIVEGFAQRIINKDVPPCLQNVVLRVLDIGLLQAGASMKGEFEKRLKSVIEEVSTSPKPIILFIDEAHTLMGGSGNSGSDAANILKPALARGNLKTIAATTWTEYKKYIEKDPALTRRFQVVKIPEPTIEDTITILRGLVGNMEKHHRVTILDEGLETAAKLSQKYLTERKQPDKAISLIDTSASRVAISLHSVSGVIENSRSSINDYETELQILEREKRFGAKNEKHINEVELKLVTQKNILEEQENKWNQEKKVVEKIFEVRDKLRDAGVNPDIQTETYKLKNDEKKQKTNTTDSSDKEKNENIEVNLIIDALTEKMIKLKLALSVIQGEHPHIFPCVNADVVGNVVSDWTGIPTGKMVKNEITSVLKLSSTLTKRVIGQNHAMEAIAKRIKTSRAEFDNPNRPIGVFMLVGPSGVGKTETALALAEALYGGEENIITINMSEFQEAHTVSTLKGAPPGYVGYGEGGVLTEAVRRKPYSIILLDEVEKAHPDVHEIFFQVFDKGMMDDGEGRRINFKNTIIILTSNVGTDLIMDMCENSKTVPDSDDIAKALKGNLLKVFPAALLGRLVVIPYYPISNKMLDMIITLQLGRIQDRLMNNKGIDLTYNKNVVDLIASRCCDTDSGARMVDAILTHDILPAISTEYLNRLSEGKEIDKIGVKVIKNDFLFSFK